MPAFTAWKNSVSGWVSPKAIWYGRSPPRWAIPPGRYLTKVRVEAAMRLLLHREYTLDVIASLCGFSGANYLCRVFKKETGHSPAQWRAMAGQSLRPGLSPEESQREQELYI